MIGQLALVAVAMFFQDFLGAGLVVAEANKRALVAGSLDACGDIASRVGNAVTSSIVARSGWGGAALASLGVTAATSFVATNAATRTANRLLGSKRDLEAEVDALKSELAELRSRL